MRASTISRPCLAVLAAAWLITAPAGDAAGQQSKEAESLAAAQALFDEAVRLFEARDYAAACPKLEASLALVQGLGTRGKLAECYERSGRLASAWAAYREVAALAQRAGDARRARVAEKRARALEPRLPRLIVRVDEIVPGLAVTRDGTAVDARTFGTPIAVDPGPHEIEARAPGHEPWRHTESITEGASATVRVPRLVAMPSAPDPTPPALAEPSAPAPPAASSGRHAGRTQRTVGLAVVGTGVIGLAAGGYLGIRARSLRDRAYSEGHCNADDMCNLEGYELIEQARTNARRATVLVGVGAVAVIGGGLLWWLAPRDQRTSADTALHWTPSVDRTGVGVTLSGRF
jgi:hypothetical protein